MEHHERPNSRIFEGHNMTDIDAESPLIFNVKHPSFEGKGWLFTVVDGNIGVSCIVHPIDWWNDTAQVKAMFLEKDPDNETHNNDMWDRYGALIIAFAEA